MVMIVYFVCHMPYAINIFGKGGHWHEEEID
jgi:hypothetical protein